MSVSYVKCDYDKKLTAVNDVVVIRKLEKYHQRTFGDIIIPDGMNQGHNLTKGVVESVGPDAVKEGIEVGMVVLYDHFAGHYLTDPVVCVNSENVICQFEEDVEENNE